MTVKSRVLALALLLLPQLSLALGLGDIRLNSSLNAPLDAEIELIGATPEELSTLKAQLASKETFARYGLEWPAFLSGMTVTQGKGADGTPTLHLRTREPVTEPFVTLLVEVNWARGRLVREYTVLMDPPVFAPEQSAAPAPVAAPSVAETRSGQIERPGVPALREVPSAPAPERETPPAPSPVVSAPAAEGDRVVQRGETLTSIAGELAGGTGTSQMMVGLYQANPAAFGGNMNVLRAGSVLRVPDAATLAAIDTSSASAEVRRQFAEWRARTGVAGAEGGEPERLRLVAPSQAGSVAGSPDAAAAAQVNELQGRVRELEGQLSESRKRYEVQSAEMARLQEQLARARTVDAPVAAAPPVAAATPEPAPAEETGTEVDAEAVSPPPASGDLATEPEAAAPEATETEKPAAVKKPKPAKAPAAPEPSLLSRLMGYWYLPLLLLLGVLGFFGYRKWKERETQSFDDSLGRLAEAGAEAVERRGGSGWTDTARLRKPVGGDTEQNFLVEESGSHERPRLNDTGTFRQPAKVVTSAADPTISNETAINLDQGDPLAEADFHMAYGLYDQAADLVRIAIQREPQRRDLKLKLLEVFFVWGNKDQFLQTARQLAGSREDAPAGEWDKIVIMGKQLAPEDELFQQSSPLGGAIAGGIDLDLEGGQNRVDYDLLGDPGTDIPKSGGGVDLDFNTALGDRDPTGEANAVKVGGDDLDFLLDEPQGGEDRSGNTTREMTAQMTAKMRQGGDTVERTAFMPEAFDAPTIEQPALRSQDGSPTMRQKVDVALRQGGGEQTAELAIDDLGLDLGALDGETGSHDAPTMVAGLDDRSRRIMEEAERRASGDTEQAAATGNWYTIGSTDQTGTNPSIADVNATASLRALPETQDGRETSRLKALRSDQVDVDFGATDAFGAAVKNGLDLDVGTASPPDNDGAFAATQKVGPEDLALPDLEPVTMSEVGTKLDLARAYMDMGDPDGARSILKEVLQEGSVSQKQEAQRLIDALPG